MSQRLGSVIPPLNHHACPTKGSHRTWVDGLRAGGREEERGFGSSHNELQFWFCFGLVLDTCSVTLKELSCCQQLILRIGNLFIAHFLYYKCIREQLYPKQPSAGNKYLKKNTFNLQLDDWKSFAPLVITEGRIFKTKGVFPALSSEA